MAKTVPMAWPAGTISREEMNMGFFRNMFDVGGQAKDIGEGIALASKGLDALFTSKEEKLTHEQIMERIKQQPSALQVAVNQTEAQHRTVFVAGWRPFVGWVCGTGLAYHFIIRDLLGWALSVWSPVIRDVEGILISGTIPPPPLDMAQLITLLIGMLGIGAYRSYDKRQGTSK